MILAGFGSRLSMGQARDAPPMVIGMIGAPLSIASRGLERRFSYIRE